MTVKRLIIILLLILGGYNVAGQAETTHPFECLPELGLDEIEARSIWVGYEFGGWDVPGDTKLHGGYNNKWIDTYRFWHSDSADEYYVFVYDTEPIQEGDKPFLSWHPCGQGAITPEQYEQIRERVNNDD